MVNTEQLQRLLSGKNAQQIARLSGLSAKTIYRLQRGYGSSPTLDVVERVLSAIAGIQSPPKKPGA